VTRLDCSIGLAAALALLLCNGCNGASDGGDAGPSAPDGGSSQPPPQGQLAVEAWLASGSYLQPPWRCESGIMAPRLNGAHGRNRTCTNDILLGADSVPYPVGSASVKEMFDAQSRPNGFAVSLKVAPGSGNDSWYWYERPGSSPTSRPVADGVAVDLCGGACHADAPRDNVFFRAP
jgi:hypothetical protein